MHLHSINQSIVVVVVVNVCYIKNNFSEFYVGRLPASFAHSDIYFTLPFELCFTYIHTSEQSSLIVIQDRVKKG